MTKFFTEPLMIERAIANIERSIRLRQERSKYIIPNSFEARGNDECISRAIDTLRALRSGTASKRQISYWLNH